MKTILLSLLMISSTFASTVDDAKSLYSIRESSGAGLENALKQKLNCYRIIS